MKSWQVVGVLVLCILVGVAGWASQQAVNDYSRPMGSGGQTAGQGWEIENIPLNPAFGTNFQIEVTSLSGQLLNVYYTNETDLRAARLGEPFDYDPRYSQLNTTHVRMELTIPSGSEVYEIMITSSDPQEVVPFHAVSEQSHLPMDMKSAFQVSIFICQISSMSLFVLLIYSISKYRSKKNWYN